ncbi:fluoride efflux transporter CrcB [Jhaorihella thermophila]|uniref:Fluoride-specific ion channel FluC n=1 Tax=Jhaorihella thermophila TaxID=488547 RepID=A0A1H5XBC0_9RHOB|nr:fluoride efflux transporter CrcB [Jhaorihella thermophila]SEG08740.1 CrcB protein [Jhaorihella thermophila]
MISTISLVALGGAAGATLRYLAGLAVVRVMGHSPIPLAILSVNVVGSFLMGVFVTFAAHRGLTHLSPLIMTGFLGGFTTFSTFSLETVNLYDRDPSLALLYVALSVGLSVGALVLGMLATRGAIA